MEVNSVQYLQPQLSCWKYLGAGNILIDPKYNKFYSIYSTIFNLFITIGNPAHFVLQLFRCETQSDNFKNLAITIVTVACTIKFVCYARKLQEIQEVQRLLHQLDASVASAEEKAYLMGRPFKLKALTNIFICFYIAVELALIGVTILLIVQKRKQLMYPAWFPFDWQKYNLIYVAHLYHICAIMWQIAQNFADDTFPVVTLCLICTHAKLLGIRLSQLGRRNQRNILYNEEQLRKCILDQLVLYELFDKMQDILWLPMFVQFCVSGFNICLAIAALLLFIEDFIEQCYYTIYLIVLFAQAFPVCYIGSALEWQFARLTYEIFSCSWIEQSARFKRNMLIFSERSLRDTVLQAGGITFINIGTLISLLKGAYSLLALIRNMSN